MMEIIGRFAPEQHIYSIDESFLSFRNVYPAIPCLISHGRKIRRAVWKEARLPVCVGIGETLTLAKVANHAAKHLPGYAGVCAITTDEERSYILEQMETKDVWGVGKRIAKRLEAMKVNTALALSQMEPSVARQQFSIELERTVRELNGIPCKGWDAARADKKQIFSTRSMGNRISDKTSLLQAITKHVAIAAAKARQQGSLCKTLLVFASNSPFDDRPTGFKITLPLEIPTNDTCELIETAVHYSSLRFQPGVRYYKVGVGLVELCSEKHFQQDLFNQPKSPTLMKVLDCINARYGTDSLFVAGQGVAPKWQMKRDLLTPQYTTQWSDIPRIKC
ncbi:Y-family DNA polymerase [Shewanella marisflavi]|uniref:Y-family DNA polymerase n=1 Tax=Shewanella marisflavi TaxID=260364 RepID=A0ABX5WMQ4_9GAMM|nr:Y-family DNA polymerase [Shewanella marisflavi]